MVAGQLPNKLTAFFRCLDFDNRRIAEIELRTANAGDERSRGGDAWRFGGGVGPGAHFEIPKWPADVDHAGDTAPEIAHESVIEM